jgi:mRNA-degrading endonuclease RelE of RelBE toxin-antitoxin system
VREGERYIKRHAGRFHTASRTYVNEQWYVDTVINTGYNSQMERVVLSLEAQSQFNDLPRTIQARMLNLFERLEVWPNVSGVKALRGQLAGSYRLRTGAYRLQFRVESERVLVEKIGHRDRFYED